MLAGAMDRIDSVPGNALDTVESVKDAEAACDVVDRIIGTGDTVLVKASRAVGLESVARSLELRGLASGPR